MILNWVVGDSLLRNVKCSLPTNFLISCIPGASISRVHTRLTQPPAEVTSAKSDLVITITVGGNDVANARDYHAIYDLQEQYKNMVAETKEYYGAATQIRLCTTLPRRAVDPHHRFRVKRFNTWICNEMFNKTA